MLPPPLLDQLPGQSKLFSRALWSICRLRKSPPWTDWLLRSAQSHMGHHYCRSPPRHSHTHTHTHMSSHTNTLSLASPLSFSQCSADSSAHPGESLVRASVYSVGCRGEEGGERRRRRWRWGRDVLGSSDCKVFPQCSRVPPVFHLLREEKRSFSTNLAGKEHTRSDAPVGLKNGCTHAPPQTFIQWRSPHQGVKSSCIHTHIHAHSHTHRWKEHLIYIQRCF